MEIPEDRDRFFTEVMHSVPLPQGTGLARRYFVNAFAAFTFFLAFGAANAAFAADGSGTNTVVPTEVTASSTGNTLDFTFTATEGMNSGDYTIAVPSDWSTPTSTVGAPGYTVGTTGAGNIADILDNADSITGWSAGTACVNGFSATTTVKEEGTASISCRNGNVSIGNRFYKNITTQDWSGYTKVAFWVRVSNAITANQMQFAYSTSSNLPSTSTIAVLSVPAVAANTWTYVILTLSGTRTAVKSFGIVLNHSGAFSNRSFFIDDLLIGPGSITFPGGNLVKVDLLSLATGTTVVVSYGNGGGSSGATSPPTGRVSTFLTQARTTDGGTLTTIAASPIVTVNNPAPTLATITPNTKNVGDGTFTLTLDGTGFNASSTAYFSTSTLATTYVSSTQITASVPGTLLTAAGSFSVTVANPTPGGGTSTAQTLTVNNLVPTLTSIVPNSATVGDSDTPVVLTGTNFVTSTVAKLNGTSLVTTYNSSTQVTATVASSSLLVAGTFSITAFNPTPGGGSSGSQVFTVNNAVPTISSISPQDVEAGGTDFTLAVNGTGFATSSVVSIDGNPLVTTYLQSSHLDATVLASYIAVSSTHDITVFNPAPGGGTSTASILFVSDTIPPAITITAPTKISQTTITDTTIHVTDAGGVLAADVVVDPSTTAGTSSFNCTQTNASTVDCTIQITASGNLVIKATGGSVLTNSQTETGYRVDTIAPLITITAPTTVSSTTITNTTIHVEEQPALNSGILATNVVINGSTTAGTSGFSCTQTDAATVDCTVNITSSGNLVIDATDNATNTATLAQNGYVVDAVPPVIAITAPTKLLNSHIADTTVHVTDDQAISAADVGLDLLTTATVDGFACTQTNASTVDCTMNIDTSGNIVIDATDTASNAASQAENGYVVENVPPVIAITAPTLVSASAITDTTIHVTDNVGIQAANVTVSGASSAGSSNFICVQTDAVTVDCTIQIDSSGQLVINAVDDAGNSSQAGQSGYVVDNIPPVITFTAPTTVSSSTITDTTIQVTDDYAITASNVTVDPSTTAGTSGFSCTQADAVTVDCTISITSSGDLTIAAVDDHGNAAANTQAGYIIESVPPVIVITAPTTSGSAAITDTTIRVTDNVSIASSSVSIAGSTAGTSGFACVQTSGTQVDCTVTITSSGTLTVNATDAAGNPAATMTSSYQILTSGPGANQGGGIGVAYSPPAGMTANGVASPLDFTINGGAAETQNNVLSLSLNADPSTVRGYAVSLDPQLTNAPLLNYANPAAFTLPDVPGTYQVYLRYYSLTGQPSAILSHAIAYKVAAGGIPAEEVLDPSDLSILMNRFGSACDTSNQDLVLQHVYADAKEFGLVLSAGQAMAIRNFIICGISSATNKFGSGERRAIARDYMDTVRRPGFVWSDIERLATGQIPLTRNLAREQARVNVVLPVFRRIFGHVPDFSVYKENLAWNTMLYRIRFPRDLAKELSGNTAYLAIYHHRPVTPFSWSIVRMLGYVK